MGRKRKKPTISPGLVKIRCARGLAARIAKELRIDQGAISGWKEVPPKRCKDVSRITGIALGDLNPTVYGGIA